MAGSSFFKRVRKVSGMLAIIIPLLALSGCGEGDGPTRILGTAATPLPPGFEDRAPTLGVFSETNTDPVVTITDIQFAGNEVVITQSRDRVFEGAVSLGFTFTTGGQTFGGASILFDDADLSPYNTLKFSIDTSSFANFANLTVQLEPPPGGSAGNFVFLSDYIPVATEGNWNTYEIPLAVFTSVDLASVNKLGFFNARDGSDVLLAGTLYLDDIHFTVTDVGGPGAGNPIDPEVVLYATDGDPDLVIPDDYDDVTDLGSGSVPNLFYADDDTYSKVLSVFSGTNNGANVAKVGFIGFDPGFVTFYEDLIFKVKGMPNFVVFVTLYEDGDPVRINLTSSDFAEELENGWYQVSIPISSFNGLTTATGIVFESDETAEMQFTFFLTDVGFSAADGGGNGGNGGVMTAGIVSETNNDTVIAVGGFVNSADFGGNNTVGTVVAASSLSNGVTAFDGTDVLEIDYQDTGGDFGGALIDIQGADISAYTTLKFSINTSQIPGFVDLTVQIEPPGGPQPGNNVALSDYTPVATSGDWSTYEIPLADFPGATLTAVNVIGFWNARDGSGALVYGQLYLDDVHLIGSGGGGGNGGGGAGDLVVDGGFETAGTSGLQPPWIVDELGGTVTVSDANSNGGTYAARLQADASSGSPSFPILKVERLGGGTLTGGAPVTIQFDAIDVDTAGVGKTFVAEFFTERADPPGGATNEVLLGGYGLSGSWQTFTYNTFLGADAAGGVSLLFKADCGANTACTMDVFIDNVSIVIN